MNLPSRLKVLRASAGLTQASLAKKANVSQTTISDLERGRNENSKELPFIAAALGTTTIYLLTGKGSEEGASLKKIEPYEGEYTPRDDEIMLPYYREVKFAAGDGEVLYDDAEQEMLPFKIETLRQCGVDAKHVVITKSSGHSMLNAIPHGASIGIDQSKKQVIDGEIYAILHGDQLRVKYMFRQGGTIKLVSENPDKTTYPDEIYTAERWIEENMNIVGWVWWVSYVRRWG